VFPLDAISSANKSAIIRREVPICPNINIYFFYHVSRSKHKTAFRFLKQQQFVFRYSRLIIYMLRFEKFCRHFMSILGTHFYLRRIPGILGKGSPSGLNPIAASGFSADAAFK
jgi:hypothetical protein